MKDDNGGPAFPVCNGQSSYSLPGMTLRDYFAAKAMQGLLAHPECGDVGNLSQDAKNCTAHVAEEAYAVADAMLKERSK